MIDQDIFTEQTEYIPGKSFTKWTIDHHDEASVIKKLTQEIRLKVNHRS